MPFASTFDLAVFDLQPGPPVRVREAFGVSVDELSERLRLPLGS